MNLQSLPGACFRVDRCQEKKFNFEEKIVLAVINSTLKTHEGILSFFCRPLLFCLQQKNIGTSDLMPCLEGMNSEKRLRRILFGIRNHELLSCPELTYSLDDNLEDLSGGGFFFPPGSLKSFAVVIDVFMFYLPMCQKLR